MKALSVYLPCGQRAFQLRSFLFFTVSGRNLSGNSGLSHLQH